MADQASKALRQWAARARKAGRSPISREAKAAIGSLLEASALDRMERAISPDGTPHRPLSPEYAARKERKRGHRKIWQLTGDSKRRTRASVTARGVRLVINTPYSAAVHDGAVITHQYRPKTSSDLAAHTRLVKASRRSARRRRKARNAELMQRHGVKTAAAARRRHARDLKVAAAARRRGEAELLPQHRRPRGNRITRVPKSSWTIRIPARPVLGISDDDAIVIKRILTADLQSTLRGREEP